MRLQRPKGRISILPHTQGSADLFMNTHLAPEMPDNFVAYRDVGEERKPGAVSFEILGNCSCIALPTPILGLVANSLLLAANSTLLSNISGTICYVMNRSELP